MTTTTSLSSSFASSYFGSIAKPSMLHRLFAWCTSQNDNRLLWLGVILVAHGCIITPVTCSIVMFNGHQFVFIVLAIISMAVALVTNLAAMPTKYTLPAFFLSLLMDAGIIITALCLS